MLRVDPGIEDRDAHALAVVAGCESGKAAGGVGAPVASSRRLAVLVAGLLGEILSTSGRCASRLRAGAGIVAEKPLID